MREEKVVCLFSVTLIPINLYTLESLVLNSTWPQSKHAGLVSHTNGPPGVDNVNLRRGQIWVYHNQYQTLPIAFPIKARESTRLGDAWLGSGW